MATDTTERRSASELATELEALGDRMAGLRAKPADQRSDNWQDELKQAALELRAADAEFTIAWQLERYEREAQGEAKGPQGGHANSDQFRSPGWAVTESEAYRSRDSKHFTAEVRTILTSLEDDSAKAGLFVPRGTPFLANPREQRLFVRDLIPFGPTSLNSVPYIRELSPATNETGASAVAEGSAKPEVTAQFEEADANIRKIAAWIPVTNEVLDDAPTLRGYVDGRLRYMLAVREEQQILYGSGTAPQLRGIYETTGTQTQSFTTTVSQTIAAAIGKIENVDGFADAVVMNPVDFWAMVATRSANQYDGGAVGMGLPYGPAPTTIWGVPVVRSRAITAGNALVGNFGLGAQGFDRMQSVVKSTDSHDDYFVYNKTVLLAEERIGLAVHRPDFFVETALS